MFYQSISSKMYALSEQFNIALMGFIYPNKFTYLKTFVIQQAHGFEVLQKVLKNIVSTHNIRQINEKSLMHKLLLYPFCSSIMVPWKFFVLVWIRNQPTVFAKKSANILCTLKNTHSTINLPSIISPQSSIKSKHYFNGIACCAIKQSNRLSFRGYKN